MLKNNLILLSLIMLVMSSIICGCSREYNTIASFGAYDTKSIPAYALDGNAIVMHTNQGLEVIQKDGEDKFIKVPEKAAFGIFQDKYTRANGNHVLYRIMNNPNGKFVGDDPGKYPEHESSKITELHELDIETGKSMLLREFPGVIKDAMYSSDGSILAVVNEEIHMNQGQPETRMKVWLHEAGEWRKVDEGYRKRLLNTVRLSTSPTDENGIYAFKVDNLTSKEGYTCSLIRYSPDTKAETIKSKLERNLSISESGIIQDPDNQLIYIKEHRFEQPAHDIQYELALLDLHTGKEKTLYKETGKGILYSCAIDPSKSFISVDFSVNSDSSITNDGIHFINQKTGSIVKSISVKRKERYPDLEFVQWHPKSQKALVVYKSMKKFVIREYDISEL
ncbi:MAG: hypothetical protein ACYC27_03405 [Armatimonadota bacterium]